MPILLALALRTQAADTAPPQGCVALFDGKDLTTHIRELK